MQDDGQYGYSWSLISNLIFLHAAFDQTGGLATRPYTLPTRAWHAMPLRAHCILPMKSWMILSRMHSLEENAGIGTPSSLISHL